MFVNWDVALGLFVNKNVTLLKLRITFLSIIMNSSGSRAAADSFFKNEYADTVSTLSRAAHIGDLEAVKRLLSSGHLPQVPDNRGWTAIHSSVAGHQLEALCAMMNHKSSSKKYLSNLLTWEAETPLIIACRSKRTSIEIIKVLLDSGAKPDLSTNEGFSPLHFACRRKGNLEVVKLLVNYGADVNAREAMNGYSPLHFAVDDAMDTELVSYLVEICDVNLQDLGLETPLFKACANNFLDGLKIILKKDASSVNTIPMILFSPLSSAAFSGNYEMVKLLLDHGADTEFRGRAGIHRHSLYRKNFLPIHCSFNNIEVFKLLLKSTNPAALMTDDASVFITLPIYTMFYSPDTNFFEALLEYEFPNDFRDLKMAHFSSLTEFILHSRDFTQDTILEKFQLFFKYYSHFEPESVFEHFACLMTHDEIVTKNRFLHLLAKMGVAWADSEESKQLVIRLLSRVEGNPTVDRKRLTETISMLSEPVLSLRQLSRVSCRRYLRSIVDSDWMAYRLIRDSCLPNLLKDYLWYQILD